MRVITYVSSVADEAPEHLRACAFIVHANGEVHPVRFHAPDKHAARAKAQAWWEDETAKATARLGEERIATMKAAREKARATKAAKLQAAEA